MGESKVNLGAGSPRFKIDNDSYGTVFFDPDNPQYGPAFGPTASEVKDPEDALEAVPYEYPVSPSFRREGSPKISFGIGGYQVNPRVFFEGSQTGRTPTVSLPEGDVLYDQQDFNVSGKLGADVQTPGGDTFGASAAGYAYRGGIEFPDALKAYGAEDLTYNSRGVEPSEYRGYYQMKDGPRAEGFYRPSADPTRDGEYGGRVGYTTSFEEGGEVEGSPKVDLGAGAYLLNQDPSYDYPMNPLLPFASRNTMDVDQLSTDYMEGDTKLIVPPILADMFNAFVRGGQMLRNEAPVTSEGIAGVALDTLPGSALVSRVTQDAAMAGPGAVLGMFAGQLAKTADLDKLKLAQKLAKGGADRDEIWSKTGWFQGPDKQWRFEIDDSGSYSVWRDAVDDLKSDGPFDPLEKTTPLGGVLGHEDLYKAYPSAEDVPVHALPPERMKGATGAYAQNVDRMTLADNIDDAKARSFALHEGQHRIQGQEGFAAGGNPQAAAMQPELYDDAIAGLRQASVDRALADTGRLGELTRKQYAGGLAGNEMWEQQKLYQALPEYKKYIAATKNVDPMQTYRRLAGEAEARNVQTRMDMTPAERAAQPPWTTLDVPEADQVVRKAEGGPVSAGLGSLPASENILTSGSISMSPSKYPNVDSRTAALGSQLLKKAGGRGNFNKMLNNASPEVIGQINRIMPRPGERLQSPTEGISLLMQSVVKTS